MRNASGYGLTLLIAGAAGLAASWVGMPMAWMLGPMIVIGLMSVFWQSRDLPSPLRNWMIAVIAVKLGSFFTPSALDIDATWLVTLSGVLFSTGVMIALGLPLAVRVFGTDRKTSVLAASPGAISQIIAMAEDTRANIGASVVIHTLRVVLIVLVVPPAVLLAAGTTDSAMLPDQPAATGPLWHMLLLAPCLLGLPLATRLKLPTPAIIGPMLLSAFVHMLGPPALFLPDWPLAVAQLVLGASLGAEIGKIPKAEMRRYAMLACLLTLMGSAISMVTAALISALTGIGFSTLLMAYIPGGGPEMVLAALIIGSDPALVTTHHIFRLIVVMAVTPWLIRRSQSAGVNPERPAPHRPAPRPRR